LYAFVEQSAQATRTERWPATPVTQRPRGGAGPATAFATCSTRSCAC